MPFPDQGRNPPGQNRGLAGAGPGYNQHWTMYVFDGFPLALVRRY